MISLPSWECTTHWTHSADTLVRSLNQSLASLMFLTSCITISCLTLPALLKSRSAQCLKGVQQPARNNESKNTNPVTMWFIMPSGVWTAQQRSFTSKNPRFCGESESSERADGSDSPNADSVMERGVWNVVAVLRWAVREACGTYVVPWTKPAGWLCSDLQCWDHSSKAAR